jgi:FkbM family methyltransferase
VSLLGYMSSLFLSRYGDRMVDWLSRDANRKSAKRLLNISLRAHGYNNYRSLRESGELHLIATLSRIGVLENCLDVGANRGDYARALLNAGAVRLHAYEPHPDHAAALDQIAHDFPNRFFHHQIAISDQEGTAVLHFNRDALSHASLSQEMNQITYVTNAEQVAVSVATLDSELERVGLPSVSFLKIDTEGYEEDVLAGAREILEHRPPMAIQLEFNVHQLFRGHSLSSLSLHLSGFTGFQLLKDDAGVRRINPSTADANIFHYSNFVFIRNDVVPAFEAAANAN